MVPPDSSDMRPTMKVTNGRFLRIIASRLVSMPRPLDGWRSRAPAIKTDASSPGYCQQVGQTAQPCSRPCTIFALSSLRESLCPYSTTPQSRCRYTFGPINLGRSALSYASATHRSVCQVHNVCSNVYVSNNASSLQDIC